MSEESAKEAPKEEPCACTDDVKCAPCIERMRAAGIPDHTIKWMQQSKADRIRTVMF